MYQNSTCSELFLISSFSFEIHFSIIAFIIVLGSTLEAFPAFRNNTNAFKLLSWTIESLNEISSIVKLSWTEYS